jgi:hypothetical protein
MSVNKTALRFIFLLNIIVIIVIIIIIIITTTVKIPGKTETRPDLHFREPHCAFRDFRAHFRHLLVILLARSGPASAHFDQLTPSSIIDSTIRHLEPVSVGNAPKQGRNRADAATKCGSDLSAAVRFSPYVAFAAENARTVSATCAAEGATTETAFPPLGTNGKSSCVRRRDAKVPTIGQILPSRCEFVHVAQPHFRGKSFGN